MKTARVPERTIPAAPFQKNASDRQAGQELPAQSRSPLPRNRPPSFRCAFSCDRFPEPVSGSDAAHPRSGADFRPLFSPLFFVSAPGAPKGRRTARLPSFSPRPKSSALRTFPASCLPLLRAGTKNTFPSEKNFFRTDIAPICGHLFTIPRKNRTSASPTPPGRRKILSLARPFFRVKAKNFPKTSLD